MDEEEIRQTETSIAEVQHQEADAQTNATCVNSSNVPAIDHVQLEECKAQPEVKQGNAWGVSSAKSDGINSGTALGDNEIPNRPLSFASIMAEQISESEERKVENTRSTRVKFSAEVESEEERQMRLAIEASLRDENDYFHLDPRSQKPALKKGEGVKSNNHVSFAANDMSIPVGDDMDDDMRIAIALSLSEAGGNQFQCDGDKKPAANDIVGEKNQPTDVEKGENMPDDHTSLVHSYRKEFPPNDTSSTAFCKPVEVPPAAAFASASASNAESEDVSEQLARALHEAELAEFNSQKSSSAAAEEASLKLAMMLQKEEDDRLRNNLEHDQYSEAARLKREAMCHGGGIGGGRPDVGVRTVNREEFNKIISHGNDWDVMGLRKSEEKGMGKFLRSGGQFNDDCDAPSVDPCRADQYIEDYDDEYYDEYEEEGIRMNPQTGNPALWKRLDKNTFVMNNEIRTKHDPELGKSANATKLKDAYSIGSSSVSDSAYNSFKRAEARQTGMKKGVAKQGHGRAENMNAGKTRGGAMDGPVRLQIAAAINQGLIERCNGVVKEGKEALVYHAEGTSRQLSSDSDAVSSDGYDVAVKVFKRISEFKGRGQYVDGDPRFHKQKFKSNDQREQVVLWAEKEYRNLIRAHRGGVKVPLPLRQKENVLFMRFLGENGWPSPQLREVDIKKGSDRWTVLYCQTIAAIKRLV